MKNRIGVVLEDVRQGNVTVEDGIQKVLRIFAVSNNKEVICPDCLFYNKMTINGIVKCRNCGKKFVCVL